MFRRSRQLAGDNNRLELLIFLGSIYFGVTAVVARVMVSHYHDGHFREGCDDDNPRPASDNASVPINACATASTGRYVDVASHEHEWCSFHVANA